MVAYGSISRIVLIVALGFTASAASAREYYYFNKASVSREQFIAERTECLELSGDVKVPRTSAYVPYNNSMTGTQNAAAAGIAGLFMGLMRGSEERRLGREVERTCMADKGYQRYVADKKLLSEIDKIDAQDTRIERYFALASTSQPVGEKVKE
jgi:hypothetical protein